MNIFAICRKDIYIDAYNGAVLRDVMIFSTPSKSIPDETADTQWNVTARVYYDSAADQEAVLTFHRIGSREQSNTVTLKKGQGNSVDITVTESVSPSVNSLR